MNIPTAGYIEEERNLGGFGHLKFKRSTTTGLYRIGVREISSAGGMSSYLSIGGFRIGVDLYSNGKVINIYQPTLDTDELRSTVWEGVPVEYSYSSAGSMLIFYSGASSQSAPSASGNFLNIGGSAISKDTNDLLYVRDMGTAEDEKDIMIGNSIIRVGRFGENWAIGSVIV